LTNKGRIGEKGRGMGTEFVLGARAAKWGVKTTSRRLNCKRPALGKDLLRGIVVLVKTAIRCNHTQCG